MMEMQVNKNASYIYSFACSIHNENSTEHNQAKKCEFILLDCWGQVLGCVRWKAKHLKWK